MKAGKAAAGLAKEIGSERQLKVAVFESIVKQRALEERNNKLRYVKTPKFGSGITHQLVT